MAMYDHFWVVSCGGGLGMFMSCMWENHIMLGANDNGKRGVFTSIL